MEGGRGLLVTNVELCYSGGFSSNNREEHIQTRPCQCDDVTEALPQTTPIPNATAGQNQETRDTFYKSSKCITFQML